MRTIWKYDLAVTDVQRVTMPASARLLHVGSQGGAGPTVWALVESTYPKVGRRIGIYGTGHLVMDNPGEYIGSAMCGPFVWHVFDLGES